ncbi:MAG: tRNA threonylcarbamoyladenosine dehydratase [Bacteroidales bacterium]|nr:tRNA threonylcarbamoyladenosine dehydratase [Bacteroidales bacterium]
MSEIFHRAELMLGKDSIELFSKQNVIIFGLGGVGSWCIESLVRTGFKEITLVDYDTVCETNINRQLPATTKTIGRLKTEVLKERFEEINPDVHITIRSEAYSPANADSFNLNEYDVIIDCIDSMQSKIHLIREATKTSSFFISSMGAALKIDPLQIRVDEFWEVKYDLFARRIRKNIRKGELPSKPFPCVYSLEQTMEGSEVHETNGESKRINGSTAHITAIFGFTIAGEIIKHFLSKQ